MLNFDITKLDFKKSGNELLPAIICCAHSNRILMLGYMNEVALSETLTCGQVVFYSRSKQRLWRKGETSGNFLNVIKIEADCDNDALIVYVKAEGPVCHQGTLSCFPEQSKIDTTKYFLSELETIIAARTQAKSSNSYVSKLTAAGTELIAAKVIEEALEFAQACKKESLERSCAEAADLLFHFLVLLGNKEIKLQQVVTKLAERNNVS